MRQLNMGKHVLGLLVILSLSASSFGQNSSIVLIPLNVCKNYDPDKGDFKEEVIKEETKDGIWTAQLPLISTDKPLWVYANTVYPLDEPVTGAGYYYGVYTTRQFNLSSTMHIATAEQLKAAEVRATVKPSLMIETFEGDWEKEWFTYKPEDWSRSTHKIYNSQWHAPLSAKFALDVCSAQPNKLVVTLDGYAAEVSLAGGPQWQSITLTSSDFHNATGKALSDWKGLKELKLCAKETFREKVDQKEMTLKLGAEWKGSKPEFRNLCWIPASQQGAK